jgi:hypothetical protein
MAKIALLTIATDKYTSFLEPLHKSIFLKFLPNHDKQLFVFTDKDINYLNTQIIKINHLPWPITTLMRFFYFTNIVDVLKTFDYVYYIDCDMLVHSTIDEEILPINNEIVATKHFYLENSTGTYETNAKSTAYVEVTDVLYGKYCQACFFGANSQTFIKMSEELNQNINIDLKNNYIAFWHDESHFNKYILNNPCMLLHSGYTHPPRIHEKDNKNPIKLLHLNAHTAGIKDINIIL